MKTLSWIIFLLLLATPAMSGPKSRTLHFDPDSIELPQHIFVVTARDMESQQQLIRAKVKATSVEEARSLIKTKLAGIAVVKDKPWFSVDPPDEWDLARLPWLEDAKLLFIPPWKAGMNPANP